MKNVAATSGQTVNLADLFGACEKREEFPVGEESREGVLAAANFYGCLPCLQKIPHPQLALRRLRPSRIRTLPQQVKKKLLHARRGRNATGFGFVVPDRTRS